MEFGEKLSAARKSKGFSQEELAAKIEVSRQAVSKWENGTAQPETANILKLCEVLEISPNELFGYEEKTPAPETKQKTKFSTKFLIVIAAVILFSAYLIWVDENRGGVQYYNKTLPIPITNLDIHVPPEQPDEGFLHVELTAYFETVKSNQVFRFSVISNHSDGRTFSEEYSAPKFGNRYKMCSAVIKVPIGGDSHIFLVSYEGSRESIKELGWIRNITEEGISFESCPDSEEY